MKQSSKHCGGGVASQTTKGVIFNYKLKFEKDRSIDDSPNTLLVDPILLTILWLDQFTGQLEVTFRTLSHDPQKLK
jgi:hypothetical protein